MTAPRTMLVPNQAGGSVDHFYHFLLGYLCPVTGWLDRTGATRITVRQCGPMTPWFDLLGPDVDVEAITPGRMLYQLVGRRQRLRILPQLDNPLLFDRRYLRSFAEGIRRRSGIPTASSTRGILVLDRGPAHAFYSTDGSQSALAGSGRRSVPNMTDIAAALRPIEQVDLLDAALLTPHEQVERFGSARTLVGQHGAGLTNMVWMAPGSLVVEILPPLDGSVRTLFRDLAAVLGLDYRAVHQDALHSAVDPMSVLAAVAAVTEPDGADGPAAPAPVERLMLRVGKRIEVRAGRSASMGWAVRSVRALRSSRRLGPQDRRDSVW